MKSEGLKGTSVLILIAVMACSKQESTTICISEDFEEEEMSFFYNDNETATIEDYEAYLNFVDSEGNQYINTFDTDSIRLEYRLFHTWHYISRTKARAVFIKTYSKYWIPKSTREENLNEAVSRMNNMKWDESFVKSNELFYSKTAEKKNDLTVGSEQLFEFECYREVADTLYIRGKFNLTFGEGNHIRSLNKGKFQGKHFYR